MSNRCDFLVLTDLNTGEKIEFEITGVNNLSNVHDTILALECNKDNKNVFGNVSIHVYGGNSNQKQTKLS